ncbi:MAG TPA: WYL domain-containing protein [Pseudomonadota bacterium]|jgi:proteasome accessory factor C|nr:WYL domain-containing protein [Pseudomonadota bacterium]
MDTSARLKRLLYLVPAVLARQGTPVADLAKELDVDPATLRDDIELLSQVGPPAGAPDEFLLLTIDEEDDCVYAELPQGLTRPLRLTAAEAFSLTLGLRALAGSGVRPYEDAVARLLAKIRAALGEASPELLALERESVVETQDHHKFSLLSDLHRAISNHRTISARYHSASRGLTEQRHIDPYALLNHRGAWYLVGLCHRHNEPRLFKVERLSNVVTHTELPAFSVRPSFDLEQFRRDQLFQPEAKHPQVELRFDKTLAYEVRTRFDPARVEVGRDGGLLVSFENPLSDWLVNWVLGFGAQVEVQEPAELRQKVAERAQAIAELHGDL